MGTMVLAPIIVIVFVAVAAVLVEPWLDGRDGRSDAARWAIFGAAAVMAITWLYTKIRLRSLVSAAERLAAGDLSVRVGSGGLGAFGGLANAINGIATTLAATHAAATVDRLTGVSNRQALVAELLAEVGRANRYDRPLSVAFVDIDHFKEVNDTHGHQAGDDVLRHVASLLQGQVRPVDCLARYGGDEFALIMVETDRLEAYGTAAHLRALVETTPFQAPAKQLTIGMKISCGVAAGPEDAASLAELIAAADTALYAAKRQGRNRVLAAGG